MKHLMIALAALGMATSANAQGFEGATFGFQHYSDTENDFTQYQLDASAVYSFGNMVGGQVDIGTWGYDGEGEGYFSYGLHLFYDVTPDTSVGIFFNGDDWDPYYYAFGVEAAGKGGDSFPFDYDVAVGRYIESDGGNYEFSFFTGSVEIPINEIFSFETGLFTSSGDDEDTVLSATGYYHTPFGARVGAGFTRQVDADFTNFALTVDFPIGEGRKFKTRQWVDFFPND